MTEITIGIPFQRGGRHLHEAIESVFGQTLADWLLILHFDGAASDIPFIPARYLDDKRVKVMHHDSPRGLAATLNAIAEATTTEFLARMDSDDIMHSQRLQKQIEAIRATGADVVGSKAWVIDDDTRLIGAYREPPLPLSCRGYLESNAFTHPAVMGRSSWFRHNAYDPSITRAEDKELWLRTHHGSKFFKLDDRLLYYRISRVVDRKKVLTSYRDNARVLAHGDVCDAIGRRALAFALLRLGLKAALLFTMLLLGQDERIVRRKLELAEADEWDMAESDPALAQARGAGRR